jgi:hypothetical protein
MGFGLIIGFVELFNTRPVTTFYSSVFYTHTLVSIVTSSLAAVWYRLPMVGVPLPLGSRKVPVLSYQLLTATAHND